MFVVVGLVSCEPRETATAPAEPEPPVELPAPASSPASAPESGPTSQVTWRVVDEASLDDVQQAQLAKAKRAQKALGTSLLTALTTSIGERGFSESIEFCRGAAPDLAAKVGEEHGITIGRTSHRLRNPANRAPEWGAAAVAKAEPGPHFFAATDGALGVLAPIPTGELCTSCHGAPASLAEGVEEALKAKYPEDQATGFAVDELRGWFWMKVPGPA